MPLSFHHVHGARMWVRCDHEGTRLHATTETLRLATRETVDGGEDEVDLAPWIDRRGGAVALTVDPALCTGAQEGWRLGVVGRGLAAWDGAWKDSPPPLSATFRSVAADRCGRLWTLSADQLQAWALTDLRALEEGPAPTGTTQIAVSDQGIYAIAAGVLWFGVFGGGWVVIPLPTSALAVAARGAQVAVLAEGSTLHRVVGAKLTQSGSIPLDHPLPLFVLPDGRVGVGELTGPPPHLTRFTVYTWTADGPNADETREVAGFDGRGVLVLDDGVVWASSDRGWRRLYRVQPEFVTTGRVETFALDSERYGCVWHRVFLDVCLPTGTSMSVQARTADDLWPDLVEGSATLRPRAAEGALATTERVHLGSRTRDDEEGWMDVGVLDTIALRGDLPAPFRGELPALDPLPRGGLSTTVALTTLEGLLKNGGGRYLWLRVTLTGTRKASPVLAGVRTWYARPSLLAFLPSFWRADALAGKRMDELLSLFEAPLTRIEQRLDALPALFDARATPPEALDWLASFLALTFDQRVREGARRTLLAETALLYRRRGTVGAIERMGAILAESEVRVVEAWRLRAGHGGVLGADGVLAAVVGPGLELGGELAPDAAADSPADEDGADGVRAFYRRTAHRFAVIVYAPCTPDLAAVLDRAVELNKPAHTLHTLCWMDSGMRLGSASYVGLSTLPGAAAPPPTMTVGPGVLGATTLSRAGPDQYPLVPPVLPSAAPFPTPPTPGTDA